ncbi:MAG: DUF4112 domain-containing protein [Saprospiraceae bacterium]|nr:DUF4112 domain-containing protein [Saprospiraceae bacterium]
MDEGNIADQNPKTDHRNIIKYSDWLDTKFKIPGTGINFGLDFLIGLFPVVGDVLSFGLSGGLLLIMVKKGASGKALSKMILNIILDAIVGSIPFLGDIFDLFFKANKRNLDLFQAHFEEGKHQGSAWPVVITVLILLILLFTLVVYLVVKVFEFLWYLLS